MPLVLLGDRDHEAKVRVDHLVLRTSVATLDQLRELHLLGGCQERIAAGLVEEELDRVRRHRGDRLVRVVRLADVREAAVVRELDPALLELLVQRRDLLVVEVELGQDLRERRQVDAAGLVGMLHQRA